MAIEINPSIETSDSLASQAREKIITANGRLREKGGPGFAVLSKMGVTSPEPQDFKLTDCMREEEIKETWKLLDQGKKVWWEGGDGYGKSTFLQEFRAFIGGYNYDHPESMIKTTQILQLQTFWPNIEALQHTLDSIKFHSSHDPSQRVFIVDSADYAWRRPDVPGADQILDLKIQIFDALLQSPCKVLFTAHDIEPKGKKVDLKAKNKCSKSMVNAGNNLVKQKLIPLYFDDKLELVLGRIGFPKDLIDTMLNDHDFFGFKHHTTLVNYILTAEDGYNISSLLAFIDGQITVMHDSAQGIANTIRHIIKFRNKQRYDDSYKNSY